jgi:hypothetical protein
MEKNLAGDKKLILYPLPIILAIMINEVKRIVIK